MQQVGYSFTLRHDTLSGQKAIAAGQDPEAIGYNAIFEKRAALRSRMVAAPNPSPCRERPG